MIDELSGQYLTFDLAGESYGIEVRAIREILEMQPITTVPRSSDYLMGVMNVRGRVVPVVDLRLKFDLERTDLTVNSAIVVLEVEGIATGSLIGLLVDGVNEVMALREDEVEPAPRVGTTVDGQLLKGMGKSDGRFILLLDTEAIFSQKESEAELGDGNVLKNTLEEISA